MKFLEMLIQIEINPLLWITQFVNFIMLKPVNFAIQTLIITPCIELVNLAFDLAKRIHKALLVKFIKSDIYINTRI